MDHQMRPRKKSVSRKTGSGRDQRDPVKELQQRIKEFDTAQKRSKSIAALPNNLTDPLIDTLAATLLIFPFGLVRIVAAYVCYSLPRHGETPQLVHTIPVKYSHILAMGVSSRFLFVQTETNSQEAEDLQRKGHPLTCHSETAMQMFDLDGDFKEPFRQTRNSLDGQTSFIIAQGRDDNMCFASIPGGFAQRQKASKEIPASEIIITTSSGKLVRKVLFKDPQRDEQRNRSYRYERPAISFQENACGNFHVVLGIGNDPVLQTFDAHGNYVRTLSNPKTPITETVMGEDGCYFARYYWYDDIQLFDKSHRLQRKLFWPRHTVERGPTMCFAHSTRQLYVVDVQQGSPARSPKPLRAADGGGGCGTDDDGDVSKTVVVKMFTANGDPLGQFTHPLLQDKRYLYLCVDYMRRIYIADCDSHCIRVLAFRGALHAPL